MPSKILIIDDDPAQIKMLSTVLTNNGYEVVQAVDGDDGLEKVNAENPDLIILDVQMPKMNGYAFMFELKKQFGHIHSPVIVITAKEGMEDIFKVEGVKEYLIKPVDREKLLNALTKHLN